MVDHSVHPAALMDPFEVVAFIVLIVVIGRLFYLNTELLYEPSRHGLSRNSPSRNTNSWALTMRGR